MTTQTALDRLSKVWPACAQCGSAGDLADVSEDQAVAIMAIRGRLHKFSPAMIRMIDGYDYKCTECLGIDEDASAERNAVAKAKRLKERLLRHNLLTFATVSTGFEMSNKEIEPINAAIWVWARGWTPKHGGAWFYGAEGIGKSYLARCMIMRHIASGRSAGEVSAIRLVQTCASWDWNKEHKALSDLGLLLIEDMDKAQWSMKGLEALWALMDTRFNLGLRTLVTSNGDPEFMSYTWETLTRSNPSFVPTLMARFLPMARYLMKGESLRRKFHTGEQDVKSGGESESRANDAQQEF